MTLNKEYRCNSRLIGFWESVFGRIFCPSCGVKMKEINWPYSLGWECPDCKRITWKKFKWEIKKEKEVI